MTMTIRNLRIFGALLLLTSVALAQEITRESPKQSRDVFTVAQSENDLSMFVTALQSSGMVKMLREEGPFTLFALSNRAFANLPKGDMEALLSNRAAMHVLLAHYIVRGSISGSDTEGLSSARTMAGVKLRIDIRSEGYYVNGAEFEGNGINCANGVIYVLDRFDPGLLHDAVALAEKDKR
ncbi:MAG: fasciclin domain-containing protein [Candidatus Sulfotelmatobacter sp.]